MEKKIDSKVDQSFVKNKIQDTKEKIMHQFDQENRVLQRRVDDINSEYLFGLSIILELRRAWQA